MVEMSASRRVWLIAPLVVGLSGCQIAEVRFLVRTTEEAGPKFVRALETFAEENGYHFAPTERDSPTYRDVELIGCRSKILCYGNATGFNVSVRHQDDLWQILIPSADLTAIASDLRGALSKVDGVSIEDDI